MSPFSVDVTSDGPQVLVAPHGEVDLATAPEVRAAVDGASGAGLVVLDLTGVSFLDSSGCRVLATAGRTVPAWGGRLAVVCPKENAAVYRVLELVGLPAAVALHATVASARTAG